MKGYITNIEKDTLENTDYRRVLYTGKQSQLVLMSIEPGDEIGVEVHEGHDQFIRVEAGEGTAIIIDKVNGEAREGALGREVEHSLEDGTAIVIPAGAEHNVVNTGTETLKLYTIYSPPEHKDGTIHKTKADEQEEHFDGATTE